MVLLICEAYPLGLAPRRPLGLLTCAWRYKCYFFYCTNFSSDDNATNVSMQRQEDAKLNSVGVTVGDLSNPFFVVMTQGTEQAAKGSADHHHSGA